MRRKINKRRRREGKTDYKARLKLLDSGLPRIVIRKTNRYILTQYVESNSAQDKVIIEVTSKELLKYGWPQEARGSLKSLPACYLTGLVLGKKIKEKLKSKKIVSILDIGIERSVKKSRIYAALNGVIDSGIEIKHKKEILPEEKRIKGEHLKNKINFQDIKSKILG